MNYELKNGATIGDFLTAITSAWSFESNPRAHDLLVAMRELLFSIENMERADNTGRIEMETPGYWIETLETSFLELFRQWLGVTELEVPTLGDASTLEDAFAVLFGVVAMVETQ